MTSLELHCCSSLQCSEQMNNEEKKCKERAIVKQDLFNWSIKRVLFTGVAKDLKPRSLACKFRIPFTSDAASTLRRYNSPERKSYLSHIFIFDI